jgi:hypothetical protein
VITVTSIDLKTEMKSRKDSSLTHELIDSFPESDLHDVLNSDISPSQKLETCLIEGFLPQECRQKLSCDWALYGLQFTSMKDDLMAVDLIKFPLSRDIVHINQLLNGLKKKTLANMGNHLNFRDANSYILQVYPLVFKNTPFEVMRLAIAVKALSTNDFENVDFTYPFLGDLRRIIG